jgi:hypothetical protein
MRKAGVVPWNRGRFDLARFAVFKESDAPDPPGPVTVEITARTEEEVRDLVRQERVNFDEDEDTRVRRLLQHVAVDAIYPFDIEIVDANAARHVNVADDAHVAAACARSRRKPSKAVEARRSEIDGLSCCLIRRQIRIRPRDQRHLVRLGF